MCATYQAYIFGADEGPMPRSAVDSMELLARVDAIAPVITAYRNEAETHGELAAPVVDALKQTDLVNLFLPHSLGGSNSIPCHVQVVHAVARLDSCAGWF